ncbi:MAG: anaerobic ribonucleoside-triphosphate reductase activating protein [Anaerovoracaceae bacterium]
MNYATIKTHDIANGPGVRVSLYVSGCTHHCKGCFNPETWDFAYGQPFDEAAEEKIIKALEPSYIHGFSLLGGEPFEPVNSAVLIPFLKRLRAQFPEKDIWCYSGYDMEKDMLTYRLNDEESIQAMLSCIDVLVDGEFQEDKKVIDLRFRGSTNQRIIDVKKTLETDEIVLWQDPHEEEE